MNLISWLWKPLYLPRWLFLFWRRRIYMNSLGWWRTRRKVFKKYGVRCYHGRTIHKYKVKIDKCNTVGLQIHHRDHVGQPKPYWFHFIPLIGPLLLWQIDTSDLVPLCPHHHMQETRKGLSKVAYRFGLNFCAY